MNRPRTWARLAVAAFALVVAASGCGPSIISVPSERPTRTIEVSPSGPPATPRSTSTPTTAPTPEPPATVPGNVLAAPGAIVVANIEQRSITAWVLTLDVVQRDRSIVSGAVAFGVHPDWEPRTQMGRVRITSDGWAAIAIVRKDELAFPNDGIAVINVLGEGEASDVIIGTTPAWLPDGTLLLSYDGEAVIRRITDHGFGEVRDLPDEQTAPTPVWRDGWILEGDLSGIVAWEREYGEPPYLTLRWDGGVEPRPATRPTYLAMGTERLAGVAGAQIYPGTCFDVCSPNWLRRSGELLPIAGSPVDFAWSRDGGGLVVLDLQGPEVALVRDDGDELVVESLDAALAPDAFSQATHWIGGMSDWATVIERDDDQLTIVPLDGSPAIGPLDGWLAAVNP